MADVRLAVSVRDTLQDYPADRRERIKEKLRDAGERPDRHLKQLSNREDYSIRIGDYRALVDWDKQDGVLYVTKVGHRRNVYD